MIFAKKMFHALSLSVPSSDKSIQSTQSNDYIYYDSVIRNGHNL